MALYLFRNMNNELDHLRPTQLLDQHFGLGLHPDELLAPLTIPHAALGHTRRPGYYRPWRVARQDSGSMVKCDKDKFQVNLDVQQFTPEEITVKVVDNTVVVEGKHEEKQDEHGFIARNFVRKYVLPEGHDIKAVASTLSSDGILTITAPKCDPAKTEERVIAIQQTGPVRNIKDSSVQEEKPQEKE
ncbi:lethal (2) essential for life [Carabus blaptoides fortunei]